MLRYVEDYLISHTKKVTSRQVISSFKCYSKGEKSREGLVHFMGLKIITNLQGTSLMYKHRTAKPLLPFKNSQIRSSEKSYIFIATKALPAQFR